MRRGRKKEKEDGGRGGRKRRAIPLKSNSYAL